MTVSKRTIKAYARMQNGEPLKEWEYEPRPLGEKDVEVQIHYCGICYSDIHTMDSGWGHTNYPVVVGHEITGIVTHAGANVTRMKVGDRVGVGAMVWACLQDSCHACKSNLDNLCPKAVFTYNGKYSDGALSYGGYSEAIRVSSDYVYVIPEALSLDVAAPLLCAGITVYNPLERFQVGPGKNVGVIGIGGLGHLAIQFASKMGASVSAISHSVSKRDECLKLGAKYFISSEQEFEAAKGTLDLMLVTSNHNGQNWGNYMSLLKIRGNLILLAVPEEKLSIPPFAFIGKEVSITGSLIGGKNITERMLSVAAKNDIKPWIQTYEMKNVNEALSKVRAGDVRYRIVLKTSAVKP